MTPAEFFTDSEPEQIVYKANDYFEKIDEEKNSKVEWIIPNATDPLHGACQAHSSSGWQF